MIRRAALGAALAVGLAACGGGGAIEDNLVRPGITALEQASQLACSTDADVLGKAVEAYSLLEGDPPATEADLVSGGFVREESSLWDVAGGELVPTDPGCGAVGTDVGQIVTSVGPAPNADEVLAAFTAEQIAAIGGGECAAELAAIFAAAERYIAANGSEPQTLAELSDAGYLTQPPTRWQVVDAELLPVAGSGCVDLGQISDAGPATDEPTEVCRIEAKTLTVALEAFMAANPDASPPAESQLVTDGYLRQDIAGADLVGGDVVPAGDCA